MILITGSTDGIGKATAYNLAAKGNNLLLHGRDRSKLQQMRTFLLQQNSKLQIETISAHFDSLGEINKMVENIKLNNYQIDTLINNAGVYQNKKELSTDGFEMTYAVNFLAHYSLTLQLLPLLLQQKQSRIINVSSQMHAWAKLDWENCNAEKNFDASNAYSQSKLLNVIFSNELHIRLINNNICTYALHPGVIATKLLRAGWSGGASVESGAETSVYLATKEWNKEESGLYWDNNRIVTCSAEGRKSENGQFLFDMAEKHSSIKWPL